MTYIISTDKGCPKNGKHEYAVCEYEILICVHCGHKRLVDTPKAVENKPNSMVKAHFDLHNRLIVGLPDKSSATENSAQVESQTGLKERQEDLWDEATKLIQSGYKHPEVYFILTRKGEAKQ